jgi:thioredoxin reductase (NADPH)
MLIYRNSALLAPVLFFVGAVWTSEFDVKQLVNKRNVVPVVVVGAGPAGLTAALNTARADLKTFVFTGPELGGTLLQCHGIENWPGSKKSTGAHVMEELSEQAKSFGAVFVQKTITKIDFSSWPRRLWTEDGEEINALTVIIATGGTPKTLDIDGVKKYWGKGIGICAICEAPFDKGKEVAVIGGGDTGVDKALQLAAFAKKVTIIEKGSSLTAMAAPQQYIKKNHLINVLYNVEAKSIKGVKNRITSMELMDKKTGKVFDLPVESVYFAIGFTPNTAFLKHEIDLDDAGYVITECKMKQTSTEGVFAAGTVADSRYQKAATASGQGMQAGMDAIFFLQQIGFDKELSEHIAPYYYKPEAIVSSMPDVRDENEFQMYINAVPLLVVDFYSPSCPVCKGMMSVVEKIADKYQDKIQMIKVNIDNNKNIADYYQITTLPTLLMIKEKDVIAKSIGRKSLEELEEFIVSPENSNS